MTTMANYGPMARDPKQSVSPRQDHAALSRTALQNVRSQTISLNRGDALVTAGTSAQHCFVVLEGTLRIWRPLVDGRRQITAFAFPGDWIGLHEVSEYSASVEAVT